MGIEIIRSEIDLYIDMLKHHSKDILILEKADREIEELYSKLDELNDTYNNCVDEYFKEVGEPF